MAEQLGMFGDVPAGDVGEASPTEAPPKARMLRAVSREEPVQLLLGGPAVPADAIIHERPAVEWQPWPEDEGGDECGDDPADADVSAEVADPHSSFPGRDLSPQERKLKDELRALEYDPRSQWAQWRASRPKTRAECAPLREGEDPESRPGGCRPCQRFGCQYHLATSVNEHGSLKIWWPDRSGGVAVDAMPQTCALDVAEQNEDGLFNHEIADLLAMSEEGLRLVAEEALAKLADHAEALTGIRLPNGRVAGRVRRVEAEPARTQPTGEVCAWHDTGRPPEVAPDAWFEAGCPTCEGKRARGVVSGGEPTIVEYLKAREDGIKERRRARRGE